MNTDKAQAIGGLICVMMILGGGCAQRKSVELFNGRDLSGWYTHTTATKGENPGVFVVEEGALRINGGDGKRAYYGGIYTNQAYENYRLALEYKFAGPTHGERKNNARDSGILLHCVGKPQGATWEGSIEANVMEGDTGSFWLVGNRKGSDGVDDEGKPIRLAITVEAEKRENGEFYFKQGAGEVRLEGKDKFCNPNYKETGATDTIGYRGKGDFDSGPGKWTKVECVCRGDVIEVYVNGRLANRASQCSLRRGRIGLQAEAADVLYRNVKLTELEK
ncbi:MAG TPA: DUF1080 domain-containing protein [Tepidisphaeraceae bacterium]|nr:DUF1080 domain-containing protein [Tepidisphaeraceae bacterium]